MLWLADELWLVTHDDDSGSPRLHSAGLGMGLAGGLLAELVLAGHLDVEDGRVYLVDQRPADNALGFEVLEQIRAEPQHPAPTWLAFLARTAEDRVAQRMVRNGFLRQPDRRGWRGSAGYRPADVHTAAWPAARLHAALSRRQRLGLSDGTLAGLITAVGMSGQILWHANHEYLRHLLSRLPAGLRELLALTEAAVGDATLTHHRT
jgi:hypothetical protein